MSYSPSIIECHGKDQQTSKDQGFEFREWSTALSSIHQRLALIEALILSKEGSQNAQVEKEQIYGGANTERIPFASQDGIEFIFPEDIVQCQANGNYTDIALSCGRKLLQSHTLKEIEKRLPNSLFIRVHKSHLINRQFIKKYIRTDGHYLILETGVKIPISRMRLKSFLKEMNLDLKMESRPTKDSRMRPTIRHSMLKKGIVAIWLVLFSFGFLSAQNSWREVVSMDMPEDLRMSCMLWQLGEFNKTQPQTALQKAINKGLIVRPDGKINAEIVYGTDTKIYIDQKFLNDLVVEIGTIWRNRANVWLTLDELIPTAQKLTDGYVMEVALYPQVADQGPGLMGTQDFINNGADGSGVKLAVIDGGFEQLSAAQVAGDAPPVTAYNHTWGDIEDETQHGTACLETAFDHAPGATFYIHRVSTPTDLGQAVDQAIDNNVDVITHSISWFNVGWSDNSGPACEAVSDAISNGMLFITAVGNQHGSHWQGTFSDADGDDWHQWSGGDETNEFTIGNGQEVRIALHWNADPDPFYDDYDLYLFQTSNNDELETSKAHYNYELLSWTNNTGADLDVYIAVKQDGSDINTIELFNYGDGTDLEHHSTQGSSTAPSNSTLANCISVGAVNRWDYNDPSGTNGIVASYSGRGPTNSGNLAPDIIGPTETSSFAYGGDWGGTSCSTPNVAGMAAAFWSEHDYLNASGVRMLIFRQAQIHNDWGASGNDNLYGRGGAELFRWINNSRFIYRGGNNVAGNSSLPYYNMEQAELLAPTDYTMIFLGESIPAPPAGSQIFNKEMLYISAVKDTEIEN